jgi:glycerol-1-phosphate dehydrogenase [NAD(P)+]
MSQKNIAAPTLEECLAASGGTKALITGNNVYQKVPGLLKTEYGSQKVFIIADTNTMQAAGNDLMQILVANGIEITETYIFPAEPRLHAEYCHIETLKKALTAYIPSGISAQSVVPLAIGAGTINDLVKRAAGEIALPYFCIPTAASVDGFTSFGAAILKDGFKQTLACDAPRCIVADTNVLSQAPAWLSSSGFADLAGKIIAGADWLIADAASAFGAKGADPIEPKAWAMVQHGLYDYLSRSVTSAQGDQDALKALFEALSITGFAMQYARDSRPVSGSEHMFAHVWEMEDLSIYGVPVTHGHKVAIGTLAATAFLEILLADSKGPPPCPSSFLPLTFDQRMAQAKTAFTPVFKTNNNAMDSVLKTCADKFPDLQTAKASREGFLDTWKDIRSKVIEQITPYHKLKEMLKKAQCPVLPSEINLTRTAAIECARRAQMIRKRYNGLDLAMDMGCFDTVLKRMETSNIYLY